MRLRAHARERQASGSPRARAWPLSLLLAFAACGGDDAPATVDASRDASDETDAPVDTGPADAAPEAVLYASTATSLYRFDPLTFDLAKVADFSCGGEGVQNLAEDGREQLYAVTTESFVRVDRATAKCTPIAKGQFPRALGFVPAGMLDPVEDVLVGYNGEQYVRIDVTTGKSTFVGALNPNDAGGNYDPSGDLVAIVGGKTYLTALGDPTTGDVLLEVDPATGRAKKRVGTSGRFGLVGVAAWAGTVFAFSSDGRVYRLGKTGLAAQLIPALSDAGAADADAGASDASTGLSFTGAAVTTRAPAQ